jgi:uncharacterized protein YlaN (UPF0358 family)
MSQEQSHTTYLYNDRLDTQMSLLKQQVEEAVIKMDLYDDPEHEKEEKCGCCVIQ